MTIENTLPISITKITDTARTRYYFNFACENESEIEVYNFDDKTKKSSIIQRFKYNLWLQTDNVKGGYIELTDFVPLAGNSIVILRKTVMHQVTPYKTTSGFRGDIMENDLDKIYAIMQELALNEDRAPHFDIGFTSEVKIANPEPNKGLKFNSNGTEIIATEEDPDEVIEKVEELTQQAITEMNGIKSETEGLKNQAKGYRDEAEQFKNTANQATQDAQKAKADAEQAKAEAEQARQATEQLKQDTQDIKDNALSEIENKKDEVSQQLTEQGADILNAMNGVKDETQGLKDATQALYDSFEQQFKSGIFVYKGQKPTFDELPIDNKTGDVWDIADTGDNYVWNGTDWDKLSSTLDLSNYATKDDIKDLPTSGTIEAINQKVDDITTRLEGAEDALDDVETRLQTVESETGSLQTEQTALEARVDSLETTIEHFDEINIELVPENWSQEQSIDIGDLSTSSDSNFGRIILGPSVLKSCVISSIILYGGRNYTSSYTNPVHIAVSELKADEVTLNDEEWEPIGISTNSITEISPDGVRLEFDNLKISGDKYISITVIENTETPKIKTTGRIKVNDKYDKGFAVFYNGHKYAFIPCLQLNYVIENESTYTIENELITPTKQIDFGLPVPTTRENADNIAKHKLIVANVKNGSLIINAVSDEAITETMNVTFKLRGQ